MLLYEFTGRTRATDHYGTHLVGPDMEHLCNGIICHRNYTTVLMAAALLSCSLPLVYFPTTRSKTLCTSACDFCGQEVSLIGNPMRVGRLSSFFNAMESFVIATTTVLTAAGLLSCSYPLVHFTTTGSWSRWSKRFSYFCT